MASTAEAPGGRRAWTEEEKRSILAEVASGTPVVEVARTRQVSTATIYYWKTSLAASKKRTPVPPGRLADAAAAKQKQSRQLTLSPIAPTSPPTYIDVAPPAPLNPRGLSYEQLLDENARLRAALHALLFSPAR